ncbi:unnamed protein product, partial [Ectocarpus sp. 4 AP-2014]
MHDYEYTPPIPNALNPHSPYPPNPSRHFVPFAGNIIANTDLATSVLAKGTTIRSKRMLLVKSQPDQKRTTIEAPKHQSWRCVVQPRPKWYGALCCRLLPKSA